MKHFYGFLLLLWISGCASPPHPPVEFPERTWQSRQDQLSNVKAWQLSGRMAVITGVEAWHLDINWQQQADSYEIKISGPFGAGSVRLQGSAKGVYLYDDEGVYFSNEPDALLYEHTGVAMPVTSLLYWIRGLPNPKMKEISKPKLDERGRLAFLQQNGWNVELKRYVQVNNLQLPDKLFIKGKPDIEVRLVIDEWHIIKPL